MAFLTALSPQIVMYLMSFMTLGIFWVGQQTQLNHLVRSDRNLAWIQIAFLFAVTLMPFSTRLLAEFTVRRIALLEYWAKYSGFWDRTLCKLGIRDPRAPGET